MNKLFRMRELVELINDADKAYFGEDKPIMSDKEYDSLVAELTEIEKDTGIRLKNSPIGKVAGEVKAGLTPVTHTKPMLSCNKTKNVDELVKFIQENDAVISWKMDGLTLVLRYENGHFIQAITRGHDGLVGEDVTHTVKEMRNVPMFIPCKDTFEVRGEGVISFDDFNLVNKLCEKSSHPRNVASGAVRSHVADKSKLFHIDFFAFELIKKNAPKTKMAQLAFLKENNFTVVEHLLISSNDDKDEIKTAVLKWTPIGYAYPVDGLVAEYNDIKFGKSLGATAHHENRMLALKWEDEVKKTFFRGVSLNTTRNGIVSIVGNFDNVMLDGTLIHRASLHNLSNFEKFNFGIGDVISVYKANMIIPQILDNFTRSGNYKLPEFCPSCGEKLTVQVSPGGIRDLYCPNTDCLARHANKIARYCDKNAMNIPSLTSRTIEKMIAHGWIKNYKDLYHLDIHASSMASSPDIGPRLTSEILNQVKNSRKCFMRNFLIGIGIPHLGPDAASKLHQYFYGSMLKFEDAINDKFDFSHIEGINHALNNSIHTWYASPLNKNTLHALMAELTFLGESAKTNEQNPFLNKNVVVTGTFNNFERPAILGLLTSLGANILSSVDNTTDYLIYGNLPSSKKVGAAIENNINMISEQIFGEMLLQNR